MRRSRLAPYALLLVSFTLLAGLAAPEADEARGRRLLDAALEALGGLERVRSLDGWVIEGSGREDLSAELQGLSPDAPTLRPHEERVAVDRAAGTVAWQRHTPRNDLSLRFRRFIYGPDSFGVVDFTKGSGSSRPQGSSPEARDALMRRVPHLLLADAAANATRVVARPERRLDGAPHDVVDVTLPSPGVLTLLLSRRPVTLARVELRAVVPGLGEVPVDWRFRGWKTDAAVGMAPSGHAIDVDGRTYQDVTYTRFGTDAAAAAALLRIPPDLTPVAAAGAPPPPAGPATGVVAPGVHVVAIRGFLCMFVERKDSVVLFDAPAAGVGLESIPPSGAAGALVTTDLLAEVARACPGKPIRFVIVSHHHGDHLGGLSALAGRGPLTVLAAPGHLAAVRRALGGAAAPKDVRVESVAGRRTLEGEPRIDVIDVGENPHTKESLFAWLPAERLVLQGDLFYFEEGARFPPSGRETMNRFFSRWLAAHELAPRAVYGVHYAGAAGPEALERAVR